MTVRPTEGGDFRENEAGEWEQAIPMQYSYRLLPWLWKRLTGWRDAYGRKADLWKPWEL